MAQIKLNTIQIVHMPYYEKLLIQIVHMAHICKNDMLQIKDMFQIVATWLQFSTEEYSPQSEFTCCWDIAQNLESKKWIFELNFESFYFTENCYT